MPTRTKKTKPVVEEIEEVEIEETSMPDADETITFKRSHFYSALVVLAFGVGLMLGYVLWGGNKTVTVAAPAPGADQPSVQQNQPSGQQAAAPSAPEAPVRYDIPTEGYPSLGPEDAPITIVEFSDFQCPYCRRFHQQTFQPLLDAYPGQIRFVYRNLPLTSIHPEAFPAAVASLCANEQDAYWEYYEKLFSSDALGTAVYTGYAEELQLNVEEFSACLESGKFDDFIRKDMEFAFNIGVQSTPTFFINGLAFVGAQPLVNFQQVIDQELANQ